MKIYSGLSDTSVVAPSGEVRVHRYSLPVYADSSFSFFIRYT